MKALELLKRLENENLTLKEGANIILEIGDANDKQAIGPLFNRFKDPHTSPAEKTSLAFVLGQLNADVAVPQIMKYMRMKNMKTVVHHL